MPIPRPSEHKPPLLEPWVHPRSGEKLRRQSLGCARRGRLIVKRSAQNGHIDVSLKLETILLSRHEKGIDEGAAYN
jgi:hypothetical protein